MDVPVERVELSILCNNLPRSQSAHYFVVLTEESNGQWIELGRTEAKKSSEPRFSRSFVVEYFFEKIQLFQFWLYASQQEQTPQNLQQSRFVGLIELKLSELVGSRSQELTRKIENPKKPNETLGTISIFAEEMEPTTVTEPVITFHFGGRKLAKKDFFGKSDPYLEIYRMKEGGTFVPCTQTEYLKNTLNPTWKPLKISLTRLCNNDLDRPLKFICWDWNKSSPPDFIGEFQTTTRALLDENKKEFELIEPEKKKKKKKYKNSGVIYHISRPIQTEESVQQTSGQTGSFLQFIRGGCQINLIIAIDFTVSNGNVNSPTSLHFYDPSRPNYLNEYLKAITSTCDILIDYDTTKSFPVFGFGGKPFGSQTVSHCFPLNNNPRNPVVEGVLGVINVYRDALQVCELSAPTTFEGVIRVARQMASIPITQEQLRYYVLLIICDGTVTRGDTPHLRNTIDEIVACTDLPLSIIIVGVGNEDFSDMVLLDADENPLVSSNGKEMERDIVNFIPFRNYKTASPQVLAAALLEEVPGQLLSYMAMKGFRPNPPKRNFQGPREDHQPIARNVGVMPIGMTHNFSFQQNPQNPPQYGGDVRSNSFQFGNQNPQNPQNQSDRLFTDIGLDEVEDDQLSVHEMNPQNQLNRPNSQPNFQYPPNQLIDQIVNHILNIHKIKDSIHKTKDFNPQNQGFNPQNQGFNPPNQLSRPNSQPHFEYPQNQLSRPNSQSHLEYPQNQGFNPQNQGFNPQNQGFNPQNQGFNPQNQGFNPQNQGFNPQNQGFNPQNQGFNPQNQGFNPQNQGFNQPQQNQRFQEQLRQLIDMGFTDTQKNLQALSEVNGDIFQAIEHLNEDEEPPPPDYSQHSHSFNQPQQNQSFQEQLNQLIDMGFTDTQKNLRVLSEVNGDLGQALERLM
ncbi:copine [Anaeramoeba ignava]|uniref:Copine n=1 Tax=Anaeramoeba ignava TaxID=1746090 RepID=A0A9Q0LI76_ANAIG|nr:copine [Anaeramoeba ignava]